MGNEKARQEFFERAWGEFNAWTPQIQTDVEGFNQSQKEWEARYWVERTLWGTLSANPLPGGKGDVQRVANLAAELGDRYNLRVQTGMFSRDLEPKYTLKPQFTPGGWKPMGRK